MDSVANPFFVLLHVSLISFAANKTAFLEDIYSDWPYKMCSKLQTAVRICGVPVQKGTLSG